GTRGEWGGDGTGWHLSGLRARRQVGASRRAAGGEGPLGGAGAEAEPIRRLHPLPARHREDVPVPELQGEKAVEAPVELSPGISLAGNLAVEGTLLQARQQPAGPLAEILLEP